MKIFQKNLMQKYQRKTVINIISLLYIKIYNMVVTKKVQIFIDLRYSYII
jgi:hypothetical protein